jgi:hypothetical protein
MEMIKAAETQIEVAISHFNEQKKDINKYFDGVSFRLK